MMDEKYDMIHRQLYDGAFAYFVAESGIDVSSYKVIEIPGAYYYSPSKVQLTYRKRPHTKITIDLGSYNWGKHVYKDLASYLLIDEDTVETAEVQYRNYVSGRADMESRLTGVKYKTTIANIPEDANEYPDVNTLERTFSVKKNDKIYGIDFV